VHFARSNFEGHAAQRAGGAEGFSDSRQPESGREWNRLE
jgi:hypothetical protein